MGQLPCPLPFLLGSSCPHSLLLLRPELCVLRLGSHRPPEGQRQGPAPLCVTPPGAGSGAPGRAEPPCLLPPGPGPAPGPAACLRPQRAPPGPCVTGRTRGGGGRGRARERAGGSMVSLQDALLFELSIKSLLKAWSGGGGGE